MDDNDTGVRGSTFESISIEDYRTPCQNCQLSQQGKRRRAYKPNKLCLMAMHIKILGEAAVKA